MNKPAFCHCKKGCALKVRSRLIRKKKTIIFSLLKITLKTWVGNSLLQLKHSIIFLNHHRTMLEIYNEWIRWFTSLFIMPRLLPFIMPSISCLDYHIIGDTWANDHLGQFLFKFIIWVKFKLIRISNKY